jgi:hypothetical protein
VSTGVSSQDSGKGLEKGKGRDDGQEDEANSNDNDNNPDPGNLPSKKGSKVSEPASVYFTVHSEFYKQDGTDIFQSLTFDGSLTIQV